MLPRADLNLNRPPASLEGTTPSVSATDARLEIFRRLTQIAIGRELQATVESAFDDGTFLVKVADTAARMSLPVGTKVGDSLSMVFIAREPRPTFLLTQQAGSAPASLSTAARLIDHVLQAAEQEGAPTAVAGKAPLAPSAAAAAANPEKVAAALRDSLATSGLFYESHLHEWISGSRPLAELAHEPQARLPLPAREAQEAAGPDLGRLAAAVREAGDGANALMNLIRETQVHTGNSLTTDADLVTRQQAALPALDPESARMINLQLNALEHQQIRWQGELWPGQKMEWEIQEERRDGGGNAQQAEQSVWNSVVRFELPHLGNVSASIRLSGDRVQVQVNAASDDAAAALREHGSMLADALDAAGSPLDALLVKRDESA
jgi:hypothetical protein